MRKFRWKLLAGAVFVAALAFGGPRSSAVDDSIYGDKLFEIGVNEDTLEDHDIITPGKGGKPPTVDPRANILGCNETDRDPTTGDCEDAADTTSDVDPPAAVGPDWSDLFTGVLDSDPNPNLNFVVPSLKNAVGGAPGAITIGADGDPDFQNYGGILAQFFGDNISAASFVDQTTMVSSGSDTNNDDLTTYTWGTDSVPQKDDFTNGYCYIDTSTASGHSGEVILYCGVERLSPSGASHLDIEINQAEIGLDENVPCADGAVADSSDDYKLTDPDYTDEDECHFVGERTEGDILITMDFTQGGDFGELEIREWHVDPLPNTDPNVGEFGPGTILTLGQEGCNTAIADPPISADSVCAFNNNGEINGGPWPNFVGGSVPIDPTPPHNTGILPRNGFSEFGLNLTELVGSVCFNTIQFKTRSSPSFTAQIKDFFITDFTLCGLDATKACTAAINATGDGFLVDFNGTVTNTGFAPLEVTLTDSEATSVFTAVCFDDVVVDGDCDLTDTVPIDLNTLPASEATFTLDGGDTVVYEGNYTDNNPPDPPAALEFSDAVTAEGRVDETDVEPLVSVIAEATCPGTTNPVINVTKDCVTDFLNGDTFRATLSGTVTNNGNVVLENVTLTDPELPGSPIAVGTLAPGASSNFGPFDIDSTTTTSHSDTVVATGDDLFTGAEVTANATANCSITTAPDLSIVKVCSDEVFGGTGTDNGVRLVSQGGVLVVEVGTKITVTNTGDEDLNVNISDATEPGNLVEIVNNPGITCSGTSCTGELGASGEATDSVELKKIYQPDAADVGNILDPSGVVFTNTATASGTGVLSSTSVGPKTDDAECELCPEPVTP